MMHINNGWLVEALDGHYSAKSMSRNGYTPTFVVLHGTAGGTSAAGIDDWFTNGIVNGSPVQASAHVIIDQQGVVIQGISFEQAAWGNGVITAGHKSFIDDTINPNYYTISIEHVHADTANADPLTAVQIATSIDVVRTICQSYGIPMRYGDVNGGIIGHDDIDPVNRARCPGNYPWSELMNGLTQAPQTESHFMDQAMLDTWNHSSASGLNYNSGIANAWKQKYKTGTQYGPPLTAEYHSVDWGGNPIVVQEFPGARCEWSHGNATWIQR